MTARSFVLVHGAWHGSWCWRRVAQRLMARGHDVFTPTLTGLADRSHLLSRDVDLETHIADVVNLIRWEGLDDVVLVGHSYAGWVISGAVEQVATQVSSIVYLDAALPEDGQSLRESSAHESGASLMAAYERGEIARPPPPVSAFDVNAADRAWVESLLTPHPLATMVKTIRLTGARETIAKKTYIRARGSARPHYDRNYERLKADPSWRLYDVPCGHDVMVDMPERLTEILLEVA